VKLTYGQAFRLPTVYERYYSVAPNTANPALTPEKIRTTELIWEESLTQKASLSASVFSSQMKDLITQVTQADGSLQFENVQNVNSNGLELELSGRLTPGPAWTAIYSFQETRDADTKLLLSNSPRTLGKLLLSEEVPRTGMVASMDAAYRSRIEAPGGVSVSPFTVVNVTVLRKKIEGRGTISASVYNLLGKRYADPAPGANPELQIPQDGRTFRVEASWRLGKR
jgi:iron complex outermembrane receptor protein